MSGSVGIRALRRAFAAAVIALVAVWPGVHHVWMARHGGDPWKFFGWSMYAAPEPRRSLALYGIEGTAMAPLEAVPDEVAVAARTWLRRRDALGDLADAADFAVIIGREMSELEGVMIEVQTVAFDVATASEIRLEPYREVFWFE